MELEDIEPQKQNPALRSERGLNEVEGVTGLILRKPTTSKPANGQQSSAKQHQAGRLRDVRNRDQARTPRAHGNQVPLGVGQEGDENRSDWHAARKRYSLT